MWSPTHVQVTVQKAKGIIAKGKNGTNDAFVTIALGKEKYQTSVKEKAPLEVEWHEECELQIPEHGNTAEIILTLLHRNFLGVDEFLGVVNIPLADFDVYERPRNRWYSLKSKPGKEKNKPRGELEVKVAFIVKAGSLTDLSKKEKHKSSLGQLSHMAHSVGGSLLSIGSLEKRKGLKKLAKSVGHKVSKSIKRKEKEDSARIEEGNGVGSVHWKSTQVAGHADPGVISEGESEDDFTFDDLSHKSSGSSLNTNQPAAASVGGSLENLAGGEFLRRNTTGASPPLKPPRSEKSVDEWEQKLYGKQGKEYISPAVETLKHRSWESSRSLLSGSLAEESEPDEIGERISLASGSSTTPPPQPDRPVAASRKVTEDENKALHENEVLQETKGFQENKLQSEQEVPGREEKEKTNELSKFARKFKHFRKGKEAKSCDIPLVEERIIIGGETEAVISHDSRLTPEIIHRFDGKSREDLIELVRGLELTLERQTKKLKDMEDYLDNLLLRVMETTPKILQNPYVTCKTQAKMM